MAARLIVDFPKSPFSKYGSQMKLVYLKFQVFGGAQGNLLILKFVFHYRIINASCA